MDCFYYVRPMRKEDVAHVSEIDREVFPTTWPPINYFQELKNQLAHYIVVYKRLEEENCQPPNASGAQSNGFISRIWRRLSGDGPRPATSNQEYVVGFAGFWALADEVHIINIAVRESYRRRGIGEQLIIAMIEMAKEMKAKIITLEARVSNIPAQKLYTNFGFVQVGVRKAYYTDNKEDAVIMTTENISLPSFQKRFQELKQAHSKKGVFCS